MEGDFLAKSLISREVSLIVINIFLVAKQRQTGDIIFRSPNFGAKIQMLCGKMGVMESNYSESEGLLQNEILQKFSFYTLSASMFISSITTIVML